MTFEETVIEMVTEKPILFNELIKKVRTKWRGVNEDRVESILKEFGAHLRCRRFASGLAVYVASVPFETVLDERHYKEVPVREY